jgi:hypothetical protein
LETGQSNTFNQEEKRNVNRNKAKQVMMVTGQGGKTGNRRKEIKSGKCNTIWYPVKK